MNNLICGIDEAGRGPLAGPVVVAAVMLDKNVTIDGVRDSKKLTKLKRESLYSEILNNCHSYNIEIIDNNVIDKINILQSTMLGVQKCLEKLECRDSEIFMDGNYLKFRDNSEKNYNIRTIVRGDDLIFQISCASVIAKVVRDKLMVNYNLKYPLYNFIQNKGYPTKAHIKAIAEIGIIEIHRKTFCKKFLTN